MPGLCATQIHWFNLPTAAFGWLQPATLTQILEYSNVFFSGLFAVEMLLKVIADGLCGYIRVGFNVFDGFIVILRHVSVCLSIYLPNRKSETKCFMKL